MADDIPIYCNCMERVRRHVSIADQVFARKIGTHDRDLNAELIFLHFRKALEELAFASLSANREKYSATRAGFATEWNARRMLGFVEKVNPNFYPIPLKPPQATAPCHKFFDRISHDFLTKDDFVTLYDGSAEVLHCRNPYAPRDPTINIKYTVDEWSRRGPLFRPLSDNRKIQSPRRAMHSDAVDRVLRKRAKVLVLDRGYSAHSMRATFITTALENGADLEDVQRAAGHREPSTTKLYGRRGYNPEKSASFFATY